MLATMDINGIRFVWSPNTGAFVQVVPEFHNYIWRTMDDLKRIYGA